MEYTTKTTQSRIRSSGRSWIRFVIGLLSLLSLGDILAQTPAPAPSSTATTSKPPAAKPPAPKLRASPESIVFPDTTETPERTQGASPASQRATKVDTNVGPDSVSGLESYLQSAAEDPYGERYNIKLGPMTFRLTAGIDFQYNDNINLSETDREHDFIITPNIGVVAAWPITSLNTLRLTLGFGYNKYLLHPDLDGNAFQVSPDSELSLEVLIGETRVTAFDRFAYLIDPIDEGDISGESQFGRFVNEIGLVAQHPLNDLILTGSYSHESYIVLQSGFQDLSHETDNASLKAEFILNPTTTAGIEVGGSNVRYASETQGSGISLRCGPFFSWQISEYLQVGGGAGVEWNDFTSVGAAATYYYNGIVTHRLSEYITHSILASRQSEPGLTSSLSEVTHLEYRADWRMNSFLNWGIGAYADFVTESGGIDPADENLYGWTIGTSYRINEKLTSNFGYRYAVKDSNLIGNSYYQNRVVLGLTYSF